MLSIELVEVLQGLGGMALLQEVLGLWGTPPLPYNTIAAFGFQIKI